MRGSSGPRRGPVGRGGRGLLSKGLGVFVLLGVLSVVAAPAASAHAVVVSSSPSADERLPQAPTSVSIQFSESVSINLGGLSVIDTKGNRVDNGDNSQPRPDTLESTLKGGLPNGTYVANYQIISADGHPIRGSIVFGVGDGPMSDVSGLRSTTDPYLNDFNKAGQFLTYLGLMLVAGLAFFMAFVLDDGPDRRRLSRIARVAAAVGGIGIGLTLITQAALETSGGIGAIFDQTVVRSVVSQGLGWQTLAQVTGLVACLASLTTRRTVRSQFLALYGGLVATGSFVLFGHGAQSSHAWLTVPADVVHVAVGALWFGGLVGLATVVWARSRPSTSEVDQARPSDLQEASVHEVATAIPAGSAAASPATTAVLERTGVDGNTGPPPTPLGGDEQRFATTVAVVSRFSSAAAVSVVLLVLAGLTLGVVEVGSFAKLTSTAYGQLLLAKVAVVGLVLLMAGYNRYVLVPRLSPSSDGPVRIEQASSDRVGWPALLRSLRFEAAGIVVVLALTAVLANTTPSASLAAAPVPFSETRPFADGRIVFDITPNQAGRNQLTVQFTDANGTPTDSVQAVGVYFNLPEKGVGPLNKNLTKAGPGLFQLNDTEDLSIPGAWNVTLQVRVAEFEQQDLDYSDTVR